MSEAQSGERRIELSKAQNGDFVSLWSLIYEALERKKREEEEDD